MDKIKRLLFGASQIDPAGATAVAGRPRGGCQLCRFSATTDARSGRRANAAPAARAHRGLSPAVDEVLIAALVEAVAQWLISGFDRLLPADSGLRLAPEQDAGPLLSPRARRAHLIDINAAVVGERLEIHWTYSRNLHRRQTLESLSAAFLKALERVLDQSHSATASDVTPSDFPTSRSISNSSIPSSIASVPLEGAEFGAATEGGGFLARLT